MSGHRAAMPTCPLSAKIRHVPFSRSRLKTGSAAPLTFHFLVAQFEKAFAFAIPAFLFLLACILVHIVLISNTDGAHDLDRVTACFSRL
jgi:hypothetical protein